MKLEGLLGAAITLITALLSLPFAARAEYSAERMLLVKPIIRPTW